MVNMNRNKVIYIYLVEGCYDFYVIYFLINNIFFQKSPISSFIKPLNKLIILLNFIKLCMLII